MSGQERKTGKRVLNVGLLAHVDAGKTTLSESILYQSGAIRNLGRVDHQDAFLDTDEMERERGITIFSKQAVLTWKDTEITLLDTPGHVDFSAEMERVLQVLDCAVLVISGADGVQGHTETLWKLLTRYGIPVFLFVNKMDQEGTDCGKLLAELKSRFSEGCIDFGRVETGAEEVIEEIAVCDEQTMEEYLEKGSVAAASIRRLVAERKIFPCYFGSALHLQGVEELMNGICTYQMQKEYPAVFGAKVYKIARDGQGNRLTYLKVTGGTLKVKDVIGENGDKVNQIRVYSGEKYELLSEADAGKVCAVTGLAETYPGQGLGAEKDSELPILEPVLTYRIILPDDCNVHTMLRDLKLLEEEEPELHVVWIEKSQEIHVQLMGDVQIEILQRIIKERFGVLVEFGEGSIVYKETIAAPVEGVGHFEPLRHYAEVHLRLEPGERGSGIQFDSECSEDVLDRNWQRLVLTHLEEKEHKGVLTGSVITDMKITLTSGKAHLKHTEGGDFRQATYRAVRQGLKKAESVLLEPYYEFRIELPSENVGRAMTDIQNRFGVRLKYDIDTVGKVLPYADFRIRPYSVEESLTNVLAPFDYKFVKQKGNMYKLKAYEYPRRTDADGEKMLAYLNTLYTDRQSFQLRADSLKKEVRQRLGIDTLLAQCVKTKPILSKIRKFDGYTVQNFALETLPGLYICGSIYTPQSKGKHALIICPNGHFGGGRYREDQQQRMGTLARMGAVCVDYDLFGWGESALQVGSAAHRSSAAHTIQAMNGLLILDYMLASRKDIDTSRIGTNGGSGGGTHTVLLSVLDDRFTASAPVVSLASHFDGGCPCESGMSIQLSAGGTCNAELAATFAPRPQLIVSDGGDWTASVPTLEFPYLQRIYGFYQAKDKVTNVHLPKEKHDFGPNKRNAVYDFFAEVFKLDKKMLDESKVTIEPESAMYSFGEKGALLPEGAIRSFDKVAAYFDKKAYANLKSDASLEKKAIDWVASLELNDDKKAGFAVTAIYNHLRKVRDWHNEHPYTTIPEGINPLTGKPLSKLDREMIADSAMPKEVHERLMKDLRRVLTEEQIEQILDKYTVGKVAFTLKGYQAIVPNMTEEETAFVLEQLKLAREQAIDYKNMKQISAIFEIYKTKCEQYFNEHGRNWRQMFKDYVNKRNAEKKAQGKK